jgi:hypothetical protein
MDHDGDPVLVVVKLFQQIQALSARDVKIQDHEIRRLIGID